MVSSVTSVFDEVQRDELPISTLVGEMSGRTEGGNVGRYTFAQFAASAKRNVPLCLILSAKTTVIAASAFTLSWTHSVERTRWEEDWRLTPAGLEIVEARVKGSGAGMEPPQGAVLKDGWWVYRPALPPQRELVLAQSAATGEGWTLCAQDRCTAFGERAAHPAVVRPCGAQDH